MNIRTVYLFLIVVLTLGLFFEWSSEKKEAAVLRRELERLQKYLGGLKGMRRLPDVVVLVDQRRESNAVLEARKLDISLVSMLDTNCDPDLCEVPILGVALFFVAFE